MANYVVYILEDPITYKCRYVGYSKEVEKRFKKHLYPCQLKPNTYKNNWIKSLLQMGVKPICKVIEDLGPCAESEAKAREIWWIAYIKNCGGKLTNGTNGGDGTGGRKQTEEEKNKRSLANRGNKNPFYGKKHTADSLELMSTKHLGNKHSEQAKNKISQTLTGRRFSEAHRDSLSKNKKIFYSSKVK